MYSHLLKVTNVVPTSSYVTTRYFETYLLGALICRHYINFDTLLSDPSQATQKSAVQKTKANAQALGHGFAFAWLLTSDDDIFRR